MPLTDLILRNHMGTSGMSILEPNLESRSPHMTNTSKSMKMTLKVMFDKSSQKVLYAEAEEDFIDYLLIFPTITLGSMVELLGKTPSLGCISNLYKSVEDISVDRYMKSKELKEMLISPKLGLKLGSSLTTDYRMITTDNEYKKIHKGPASIIFKNSDSPTLETIGRHQQVKRPGTYMVTDDLIVTPLSLISSVSILSRLKVPVSDVCEKVVTFGKEEAARLLDASLISKSALTIAFNFSDRRKKCKTQLNAVKCKTENCML